MSVLFVAKQKPFSQEAAELATKHFSQAEIIFGERTQPFPSHVLSVKYDYVISYMSPWIIPQQVLDNTRIAAINFHPGPPEYPGIGCTNFALYNEEKEFGITVHHMLAKADTGNVILVKRFPIFENDSVFSLSHRCYGYIYAAFTELFPFLLSKKLLPSSAENWKRKPYTRKELDALCEIRKDMTDAEIKKRVRATAFPGMPGAYIVLAGVRFAAMVKEDGM